MPADPDFDVFISYAHADNGAPLGSSVGLGWVTQLAANLNEGPNVLKKRLFIDHQLRPGDDFGSDLLDKVQRSSLLVLLLSQNYVDSGWCGKELEHFIRTHWAGADQPRDVYVVELFPFERLEQVPPSIQAIRKRLIHAKFWFQQRDAAEPRLAGYPSALEGGAEGREHYWKVLNELRVALDGRLRDLRGRPLPPAQGLALPPPSAPPSVAAPATAAPVPRLGTVLLADTTDDLELQRNAVRVALEPEGVRVLPEGDYVGLDRQEFETALAADLAGSDLFVQLLSPAAGRKAKGYEAPLPQLQYRAATAAKLPILQWCDRLPASEALADPDHARLFATDTLRATTLAEFKTTVIERLRAEQARRAQAAPPAAPALQKRFIFIDDVAGERALAERVRAIARDQDFQVRSLPQGAPLGNNGIDVKELLRPCQAGLTLYSDPAKYALAYNRLVFFLNQLADGQVPVSRWGVFLAQGTVASVFGIESDEVVPVDEQGFAAFLRGL